MNSGHEKSQGYWSLVWGQFKRHRPALLAMVVLGVLALTAIFSPFIAGERPLYLVKDSKTYVLPNIIEYKDLLNFRYDRWTPAENDRAIYPLVPYAPERSNLGARLQAPGKAHWLGTDDRGRDVLSRVIWGTRVSMSVGFVAVGIAVLIGLIIGVLGGFYGGWVDVIVLRVIEIMLCLPTFIFILTLQAFLPPNIWITMAIIGATTWTGVARLVRGEFLKLRESDFAMAAKATGLSDARIMFRHLLPNAMAPVLVNATFGIAGAILIETSLSFLGFGVPPPTASWGEILSQSKRYVDFAWWLVTFPGLAIFITIMAFNLVGEGLRDAMDPRLRQ